MKQGNILNKLLKSGGLTQVSDSGLLESVIDEVIRENQDSVVAYKNGKDKLFGFFVGQVMKKTEGKASPSLVNELLKQKLS